MRTPVKASSRRTRRRSAGRSLGADYLPLVRRFPLRPIRSDREYDAAAAIIDRLAVRPEGSLTSGEQDYLDTLVLLVKAYDDDRHELKTASMGPQQALRHLMAESGMTQKQLGELLGNRPLASLILNGHRSLSKSHIRTLSDHFRVNPGLFLGAE